MGSSEVWSALASSPRKSENQVARLRAGFFFEVRDVCVIMFWFINAVAKAMWQNKTCKSTPLVVIDIIFYD